MSNIIIYSTPTCHFCHAAKDFFKENNIEFTEKDVSIDKEGATEMVKKSGQMGVPVIDIDGDITVGFDEGKLKSLLEIK